MKSILVIDNSRQVGSRIREMLRELPMLTYTGQAYSAEEGLQIVKQGRPDIIIMDIAFPVGTGIAMIEHLRRTVPGSMLILFTNYSHQLYREKCFSLGADFFFDKSTETDQLIKCLEKVSARREGAI